jgi:hypothetical protein
MDADDALRIANASMIPFDLWLGTTALVAPDLLLRLLGHERPTPEARQLLRRCGPIWLTYAAAHVLAHRRGEPRDWWAVAWLRGTEIATDIVWSRSPGFTRPGARAGLWFAGAYNLALALGAGARARRWA